MTDAAQNSDVVELLARLRIRDCLERYMSSLDRQDLAGLASCFTDDADISLDTKPIRFKGGTDLAQAAASLGKFAARTHAMSNLVVTLEGTCARAHMRGIAVLAPRPEDGDTLLVRGVSYDAELVNIDSEWKIRKFVHMPLWQFETRNAPLFLPHVSQQP